MKCLLILLFTILISTAICRQSFTVGNLHVQVSKDRRLEHRSGNHGLTSILNPLRRGKGEVEICSGDEDTDLCLKYDGVTVNIKEVDGNCTMHHVVSTGSDGVTMCFPYGDRQWYGGPERYLQEWPIQTLVIKEEPYVTRSENNQGIAEPLWLASDGSTLYVPTGVPLFTDSNNQMENGMCLIAKNAPPYNRHDEPILSYEICKFEDVTQAHIGAVGRYFARPSALPSDLMLSLPVYSTWARYKSQIDQDIVLKYFNEIIDNEFPISHLEIDDKWEPCYGAWVFDENRFPDVKSLTDYVHSHHALVSLWVYPFINEDCEPYFTQAKNEGRFVADQSGNVLSNWWNGRGATIDFTNQTTAKWWVKRTKTLLEETGVDYLKFDAGETSWLPQLPMLNVDVNLYPDIYTTNYVQAVSQFGPGIEVRVGKRTQDVPVFVRMLDKDSKWGLDNGLQSLVTTLLQMNIAGYPYVLPDMIGGNVYGNDKVSKELFIRWLQANTFMAALQFSIVPWDFDEETVNISRNYVSLHAQYKEAITQAMSEAGRGAPVNPPIWWIAPKDEDALKCKDEFLLGTSILVAPVLEEGARKRDVYLPAGKWVEMTRSPNEIIEGPTWLIDYPVALDELPYFILNSD